jgi:hypothetical protein
MASAQRGFVAYLSPLKTEEHKNSHPILSIPQYACLGLKAMRHSRPSLNVLSTPRPPPRQIDPSWIWFVTSWDIRTTGFSCIDNVIA